MPTRRVLLGAALLLAAGIASPARGQDARAAALSEQQAVAELKALGGVLVHYDDRKPGRPVILVDFTNHQGFQEPWLKYLAAFPHLTGLGLSGTSLTDDGLRYVGRLASLETLTLAETKVTDEGLVELLELANLRQLDLRDTSVTEAGVKALKKRLPELDVSTGTMRGAAQTSEAPVAQPRPAQPTAPQQPLVVPAAKLNDLRQKAMDLAQLPEGLEEPEGWSKSRVDPNRLVTLFAPLRLREGHVLRAYVFREDGNGNGVVWAMPADAEFPEPADCPTLEQHMFKAPKPWDALDDVMQAIEGDGSAWSYLSASLLRRELLEFGALWHGTNWGTHVLLDEDPWKPGKAVGEDTSPLDRPTSQSRQWKWREARPGDWRPRVEISGDRVTVTFYTYSGLNTETIYRHTDTYRLGSYRPRIEQKVVGEGPPGYVF